MAAAGHLPASHAETRKMRAPRPASDTWNRILSMIPIPNRGVARCSGDIVLARAVRSEFPVALRTSFYVLCPNPCEECGPRVIHGPTYRWAEGPRTTVLIAT